MPLSAMPWFRCRRFRGRWFRCWRLRCRRAPLPGGGRDRQGGGMRLLVLGGTEFVGRAFVEEAVASGWDVTVFNRGTHAPPPTVTALRGDRAKPGGLAALDRGERDVVGDTWSWAA